jgi:hypothetical protein
MEEIKAQAAPTRPPTGRQANEARFSVPVSDSSLTLIWFTWRRAALHRPSIGTPRICVTSDGRETKPLCGAPAPNTRRRPGLETPLLRPCSQQSQACCFRWRCSGLWTAFATFWLLKGISSPGPTIGRLVAAAGKAMPFKPPKPPNQVSNDRHTQAS